MKSRLIASCAALAALALTMPASAARTPACQEVAFSPSFSRDRTMWCTESVADDGAYVYRSTDAGRTWGRGVQVQSGDAVQFMARVIVSPLYATDRRVLVWTTDGLFESVDGGATFSVDPVATPRTEAAPYVETLVTGTPRAAFVYGVGGNGTYDTELGARSVVGAPNYEVLRYLVPSSYAETRKAVALAIPAVTVADRNANALTPDTTAAFGCTGDFVCAEKGYDFGRIFATAFDDLGRPEQHYVAGREYTRHPNGTLTQGKARAWRTNDAGRTWTGWPSVERLLNVRPAHSKWAITGSPDSRRLFLSVASVVRFGQDIRYDTDDTYAMTLWRSDDDGSTWHRMSVPWTRPPGLYPVTVTAQAGGRLYATASRPGFTGMFCSLDNGRTWRTGTCR